MSGMSLAQAQEQYKASGGAYFKLENDKDKAAIRFLYDFEACAPEDLKLEDLDCYVVHDLEINGKRRVRQCTMNTECPDCQSGNKPKLKIFIQLVDMRDNKVKIWERSGSYATKLLNLVTRYGPLCNRLYEVERRGVKGDTKTEYDIFVLDKDGETLEKLPERLDIMGTMIIPAGQTPQMAQQEKAAVQAAVQGRRPPISNKETF